MQLFIMHAIEVAIGYDVLAVNSELARETARPWENHGIVAFNIIGAGSGETLLIEMTIERTNHRIKYG